MQTFVMRPIIVALKLERLFEKKNMYAEQFSILNYINNRWPGNYKIIRKQAGLYLNAGYEDEAKELLKNVSYYPQNERVNIELVEMIQEILWRIHYKDKEASKELKDCIENEIISTELWKYSLQNEKELDVEDYLTIVNDLFDYNNRELAYVTLTNAEKVFSGNEIVLCLLANMSIEDGNVHNAVELLNKVKKPGEMTKKFMRVCKERLR